MKRALDLESATKEIVERGKAKDEKGDSLYPITQEPLVMALLGSADALFDTLRRTPLRLISLLQANRELERFWSQFEDIWKIVIHDFITRETNLLFADTYPFFAVANYRATEALRKLPELLPHYSYFTCVVTEASFMNPSFSESKAHTSYPFNRPGKALGNGGVPYNLPYDIYKYDSVTKLYVELLQKIVYLKLDYKVPNTERGAIFRHISIKSAWYKYIHFDKYKKEEVGFKSLQATTKLENAIHCLDDCFIVSKRIIPSYKVEYNLSAMHETLKEIEVIIEEHDYRDDADAPLYNLISEVKELTKKLSDLIIVSINQEPPSPVLLTKATAAPYHAILYDREKGLYNTPEKQKALFVALLRGNPGCKGDIFHNYGESLVLKCIVCHNESTIADLSLQLSFCTELCHSVYTNPVSK